MSERERVPGCGHYDCTRGTCAVSLNQESKPSLSQEALIVPPGEIEGPGLATVLSLVCTAANEADEQENCSHFIPRTVEDDKNDIRW